MHTRPHATHALFLETSNKIAQWRRTFRVLAPLGSATTRSSPLTHFPRLPTPNLSPATSQSTMIAPRALLCLALPALAAAFVGRAPTTVTRASAPAKGRTVLMESISDFLKFDAKLGELEVTKAGV